MPELPDIEAYRTALDRHIGGSELLWFRIFHPFLLRSVGTPPEAAVGASLVTAHRFGKRLGLQFSNNIFLVFHLMIAGRFKWKPSASPPAEPSGRPPARSGVLAQLAFPGGVLSLTEAGSKRRASLHVATGISEAAALNPGALEVLDSATTAAAFTEALRSENHTLKRALTDPRVLSGIGNSYSDEILFAAKLSPFAMTGSLADNDYAKLFTATVQTLTKWRDCLVAEAEGAFPKKVTAFRPEMHVHGKYGQTCDVCGTPVQRIRYAENECNYCPGCQTGGKIYADRALSRLLKGDWPRTVEELEKLGRPPGGWR